MELSLFGYKFGMGKVPTDYHIPTREEKINSVAPLIYVMYSGNETYGVWTKRNLSQYSVDAYEKCVPAYVAINKVAKAVANIPLKVKQGDRRDSKNAKEVASDHPLVKLLAKPNPWQGGASFTEEVIAYLELTGNSYIEGIGPDGDGEPPIELYVQRPDRVKVIPSKMGVAGYVYNFNGGTKRWPANPIDGTCAICHIKFIHPTDDWYGMSPVEAAANSVDSHNFAGQWNQALLQNGAKPSGALVYKPSETDPQSLTEKQKEAIKEQLNGTMNGPRNAGRVPLLDGRLEWMQMSMSPAEMDWLEGRREDSRAIAQVFGVPPMMLGIPGDNTYSNYIEARGAFYEDTVLPLTDFYLDYLNRWLCPLYGADIFIEAFTENLPAMQAQRAAKWSAVGTATWLTINEKRKATGYDPLDDVPEADEIFIPSNLIPLTGSMDPPDVNETLVDGNGKPIPPDPNKPSPGKVPPKKPPFPPKA